MTRADVLIVTESRRYGQVCWYVTRHGPNGLRRDLYYRPQSALSAIEHGEGPVCVRISPAARRAATRATRA